jgi:renal tumor antigen
MDLWGLGCVMFEMLALYPLFPGSNEADQIERIHKVLGTPSGEGLEKFKHYGSSHVDFNFAQFKRHPLGLAKLLPHVSADAVDLMHKLLNYDPDDRMTAREALRHPWFADLRAAERKQREEAKEKKAKADKGAKAEKAPKALALKFPDTI